MIEFDDMGLRCYVHGRLHRDDIIVLSFYSKFMETTLLSVAVAKYVWLRLQTIVSQVVAFWLRFGASCDDTPREINSSVKKNRR